MAKQATGRLFDQHRAQSDVSAPAWFTNAYTEFRSRVLDPDYPCYFGTAAESQGDLRYTYVDDVGDASLSETLSEFLELSKANPDRLHALIVFQKPKPEVQSHQSYEQQFWDTLQALHDTDEVAWPNDVPLDPSDPNWEFSFGGEAMFVFGASPSYEQRKSRNLGPCLTLLFQPRTLFRGIPGGTPKGDKAREIIRARGMKYEGLAAHPNMGNYGEPSTEEWKQYFLPDDNSPVLGMCPLNITGVRVTSGPEKGLEASIRTLLPQQGSVEVQRDAAGKVHKAHTHNSDETLLIVEGSMYFKADRRMWLAKPGDSIELPAGTVHESEAGPSVPI